jgi:hypothetical protein
MTAAVEQGQSAATALAPAAPRATGTATQDGDIHVKYAIAGPGPADTPPGTLELPQPGGDDPRHDATLLAIVGALTVFGFAATAIERRRRRYLL